MLKNSQIEKIKWTIKDVNELYIDYKNEEISLENTFFDGIITENRKMMIKGQISEEDTVVEIITNIQLEFRDFIIYFYSKELLSEIEGMEIIY
ncbi:MAG: hypothetical protein ACRC6X_05100 [Culicoidibacterales bacterium]